ncbi:ribosomal protein S18-alanine N-acetyltransferase [Alteromonas sp. ASW11-36]|uniref:Ribosomal protein S18-alanine N-acetyltransferase n=1 Tax=Alteromonas arenosi TaxID=3055817 RepID=A0ABT7SV33_9ALTE|nr:ribosomal protein S18-alanine N-acetyltransferase [Alteromonas sp. ASW11-36]MDM7860051.1 ribosomal protein S18-alanine N-acetyltransferase [Alteromonas sp. ASW11-36]
MVSHKPTMTITFQPLDADSAAQAYIICQQSHPVPWSERVFLDCLTAPYYAWVAIHQSSIVGYYIGLLVADEVTLMDIAVAPQQRGNGVGKALLEHFLANPKTLQGNLCWLEVRASNTAAIALYQANEFVLQGTRKNYYALATSQNDKKFEDALVMQRKNSRK